MNFLGKKIESEEKNDLTNIEKNKKFKKESPKEEIINISHEKYKHKKIIESPEIEGFNSISSLEPPSPSISLFERKKLVIDFMKENIYNVEDILEYDDTNIEVQKKYLKILINKLNNNKELEMTNILMEKIQKSGIILSRNDYEEEMKNIRDEKLKKNLSYIDYKESIINTLEYIKDNKNGDLNEAKKNLNIKKIFSFNHESTLGNNNYYFYELAKTLINKLREIYDRYSGYLYVVEKNLEYFKKDFSNLSKNDIYKFNYICNILLMKGAIDKKNTYEEIKNFMEGKPIDNVDDLKKAIEKNKESQSTKLPGFIDYDINFKNNFIEYIVE